MRSHFIASRSFAKPVLLLSFLHPSFLFTFLFYFLFFLLDTIQLSIMWGDLLICQFFPHFDKLFILCSLMTKTHLLSYLMDHFPFKRCCVVYGYLSLDLLKHFSEMAFNSLLLLLSVFLLLFVFISLFVLILFLLLFSFFCSFFLFWTSFFFLINLYLIADSDPKSYSLIRPELFGTGYMSMFINPFHKCFDMWIFSYTLDISHHDQHASGAGDRHVHSSPVTQKTNLSFRVTSDHRNQDTLFLATLNSVDSRHIKRWQSLFSD